MLGSHPRWVEYESLGINQYIASKGSQGMLNGSQVENHCSRPMGGEHNSGKSFILAFTSSFAFFYLLNKYPCHCALLHPCFTLLFRQASFIVLQFTFMGLRTVQQTVHSRVYNERPLVLGFKLFYSELFSLGNGQLPFYTPVWASVLGGVPQFSFFT